MNSPFSRITKFFDSAGIIWPDWHQILIWITGAVILVSLAIKETAPLFVQYTQNNIDTQVEVIGTNVTVTPPLIVFGVQYNFSQMNKITAHLQKVYRNVSSTCIEYEKLVQNGWDVLASLTFEKMQDTWHDWRHPLKVSNALMKKLLSDDGDNFTALNVENYDWNQPLFEAVTHLFACISEYDRLVDSRLHGDLALTWCNETATYLLSNKGRSENLYLAFIRMVCEHVRYYEGPKPDQVPYNPLCPAILEHKRMTVFYETLVFHAHITEIGAKLTIDANGTAKDGKYHGIRSSIQDHDDRFFISSASALYAGPLTGIDQAYAIYKSHGPEDISVKYLSTIVVKDTRPGIDCYQEASPTMCKGRCMTTKVVEYCKCIPFVFRQNGRWPEQLPYCQAAHYAQCKFDEMKETSLCENSCKNPCQYTTYQWFVSAKPKEGKRIRHDIDIEPIVSSLIEVTITMKYTQEQFFTQLFSVFNFYIGGSGFTLVAGIVFCFSFLRRKYYQKKANNGAGANSAQRPEECVKDEGKGLDRRREAENAEKGQTEWDELRKALEEIKNMIRAAGDTSQEERSKL